MFQNESILGLKARTNSISNLAEMETGERVIVAGQRKGTIRFAGNTQFAPGIKTHHTTQSQKLFFHIALTVVMRGIHRFECITYFSTFISL